MGYTVENGIKQMTGGNSIPISAYMPGYLTFHYGENEQWWVGSQTTFNAEATNSLNFYYKIKDRSGDSFIVSTGIYVDLTYNLPWQLVYGETNFVPQYTWFEVDKYTALSIFTDNLSYNSVFRSSPATYIGVPGVLLNYEITDLPDDDYYESYPNRKNCRVTYRYWLISECDFVLPAAAKIRTTNAIALGTSAGGNMNDVYLHFSNVPYITCPKEINDMESFAIEYSFPNLPSLEYIQFALLDDLDRPIIDYRDIPKTSNNYSFNLLEEDLAKLYAKFNTVNDTPISFGVKFKNRNEEPLLMTFAMHFTIVKEYPTMTVNWSDPKNLAGAGVFIEGKSDLRVVVNPVAYKGATIEYVAIFNGGQVYANQNDVTFTTITDKQFEVLCRDSRGNEYGTWYELSKWVPYIPPSCSITAEAPNTDGYLPVTVSGIYFDAYSSYFTNSFNIYYKYTSSNPDHSIEEWTLLSPKPTVTVDSKYRYTTNFTLLVPNHSDTYTVQVQFSDRYTTYTTNSVTVKAIPVFDWGQEDFNFNVPVTIQGDLVVTGQIVNPAMAAAINDTIPADYVVQTGTSGIWTYRLWNSGVAECWGRLLPTQYTINTAWGALFVKDNAILRQDYPFTFKELPVVSMSLYNTVGNCWAYTGTVGSTTQSPAFGLARGTSGSVTVGVELTAIGKWK